MIHFPCRIIELTSNWLWHCLHSGQILLLRNYRYQIFPKPLNPPKLEFPLGNSRYPTPIGASLSSETFHPNIAVFVTYVKNFCCSNARRSNLTGFTFLSQSILLSSFRLVILSTHPLYKINAMNKVNNMAKIQNSVYLYKIEKIEKLIQEKIQE